MIVFGYACDVWRIFRRSEIRFLQVKTREKKLGNITRYAVNKMFGMLRELPRVMAVNLSNYQGKFKARGAGVKSVKRLEDLAQTKADVNLIYIFKQTYA